MLYNAGTCGNYGRYLKVCCTLGGRWGLNAGRKVAVLKIAWDNFSLSFAPHPLKIGMFAHLLNYCIVQDLICKLRKGRKGRKQN